MSEVAQRGVTFILRAEPDESARTMLENFGKQMQAVQAALDAKVAQSAKDRTAAEATVNEAIVQAATARTKEVDSIEAAALEILERRREKVYADRVDREKKALDEAAAHEAKVRAELARLAGAMVDSAMAKQDEYYEEAVQKAEELTAALAAAASEREEKEKAYLSAVEKEQLRVINEQIAKVNELANAEEAANERKKASLEKVLSAYSKISGMVEGALRSTGELARGLTMLGLVGEENMQKVQDAILGVQGALDVTKGAHGVVKTAIDAYQNWGDVIQTVAATHELLNGKIGKGLGEMLSKSPLAGAAGGLAGRAAGMAGNVATFGRGALAVGSRFVPHLAAAGGGYAVGSGIRGIFEGAMEEEDFFSGAHFAAREAAGYATLGITTRMGLFGQSRREMKDEARGKKIDQGMQELEAKRARDLADEEKMAAMKEEQVRLTAAQEAIEEKILQHRWAGMSATEKRGAVAYQIQKAEQQLAQGAEGAMQATLKAYERRLSLEREIHAEAKTSAQQQLNQAQKILDAAKARLQAEKDSLMSAKERFGMMSEEEQQATIQRAQALRSGQAGNLTTQDLQSLKGFNVGIDQQIQSEALRRASAAGFDQLVGFDSNQRIRQMEQEIKSKLEVNVKAKAEVVARIEADYQAIANQVQQQIDSQWRGIMDKVAEEIARQSEATRQLEQQINARAHLWRQR